MSLLQKDFLLPDIEGEIASYIERGKDLAKRCGVKGPANSVKIGLHLFWYELKLTSDRHEFAVCWEELRQVLSLVREIHQLDSERECVLKLELLAGCKLDQLTPTKVRKIVSDFVNNGLDRNAA